MTLAKRQLPPAVAETLTGRFVGVAGVARLTQLPGQLVIVTVADADERWAGAFVRASLFDQRAAAANNSLAHVLPGPSLKDVLKLAKI